MKRLLLMLMLLFSASSFLLAQQIKITGKVTDASTGAGVDGVSVQVKNAKNAVTTSSAGVFSISVNKGETLIFSSIGYTGKEVVANGGELTVSLEVESKSLTDVVVVGYGRQKRTTVTGSVAVLKNEDITRRQVASSSNLLQGLVPGVTVQQQSGRPGADGASIRIRGLSSIYAGQSPLAARDP